MMAKLIVNADDFGHTPGVSRGIREAHLRGIVTSTTAMMNMSTVEEALEQSRLSCPNLGIGVHLVLTTGCPVLPTSEVGSLVNSDGEFLGEEGLIERIHEIDLAQVSREWTAQVDKFIRITGKNPDHLDSHHHATYYSPGLCEIHLQLAQKYGCGVRFPAERVGMDTLGGFSPEYARDCNAANQALMARYNISRPDAFAKTFYDETCTVENLLGIFSQLAEGTTELMCHPGYADEDLLLHSSYARQRQKELDVLTHPKVIDGLKEHQIELVTFSNL
jgi:chitin disaccharide deacetylase